MVAELLTRAKESNHEATWLTANPKLNANNIFAAPLGGDLFYDARDAG
jgi:hypothetical protein